MMSWLQLASGSYDVVLNGVIMSLSQTCGVYFVLSKPGELAPPMLEAAHDPECSRRAAEALVQGRLRGLPL